MQRVQLNEIWRGIVEPGPIVEFFAVAYKLRWAIVVGALLGFLGGLAFVHFRTPQYTTVVSVSIDPSSLPAAESSEGVLAKYGVALRYSNAAHAAFQTVLNASPNLRTNLLSVWGSEHVLLQTQTAIENTAGDLRLPLRLARGASSPFDSGEKSFDYLITAQLPARGLNSDAGVVLASAINAAANVFNAREAEAHRVRSRETGTLLDPVSTFLPRFIPNAVSILKFEEPRGSLPFIAGFTFLGAVTAFYSFLVVLLVQKRLAFFSRLLAC